MISEADAKIDIYNYAARFDGVPEITTREQVRGTRAGQGKKRRIIEVDVVLDKQNIRVTGRGTELRTAEIAAALKFKQAAERYYAEQGTEALIIKDSTALTTDNAKSFFDYYKILHPRVNVQVDTKQTKQYGASIVQAQIHIDGKPYGKEAVMINKKKAESLAYLTAAMHVKAMEPDVYPQFLKAKKSGAGEILAPLKPINMPVDEDCLDHLRLTLLDARRSGLPDEDLGLGSDEEIELKELSGSRRSLTASDLLFKNKRLSAKFEAYKNDSRLTDMHQRRSDLPMNQYRQKVLDMVGNNTYSIVIGATGSGKTTQVPQILLEEAISKDQGGSCNIVCTQPRRIAATSVGRRVAEERNEKLQDTVGYHVRFESRLPQPGGSITYCTTGILLQQLQHHPDDVMDNNTHLVIDEVHERDTLIDFLLIILKKVIARRLAQKLSVPKVVLMSATMDTDLFASYFDDPQQKTVCPTLSVPGRTFPVRERYLDTILEEMKTSYSPSKLRLLDTDPSTRDFLKVDRDFSRTNPATADGNTTDIERPEDFVIDWKKERKVSADGEVTVLNENDDSLVPCGLAATTVAHICQTSNEGAILVFMPGLDGIVQVEKFLREGAPLGVNFRDSEKYRVLMLHSSMPTGQTEVFNPVPSGCRKIILSTNIAETSVTIPDVQYVVDTGKLREKQYDQVRRITKLQCTWISKSNSKQRAGRAGRVQNGNYYALFSRARYQSLRAIGLPEMLRTDLQEICLDIKAQAFQSPIREFLASAIEPPAPSAVENSVVNLQALDCLTEEEKLTPLGRLLAALPVHPSLGKMIVLGVIFRCLDPMLILGAAAEERNIFMNPLEARREAQEAKLAFVEGSASDHLAVISAVKQMRLVRGTANEYWMRDFGHKNFIHNNAFKSIESTVGQIETILVESGLIPFTPHHMRQGYEYGDSTLNEFSDSAPLIKALVLGGLHPNLAVNMGGATFRTSGEKHTLLHPSSVNASRDRRRDGPPEGVSYGSLFSYSALAKSNDGGSLFLRETSEATPLMATLFGGKIHWKGGNVLEMDNWLPFYVKSESKDAAKYIYHFRLAMDRCFSIAFRDLQDARRNKNQGTGRGRDLKYLAEEKVRGIFAEGLVEILKRDVKSSEALKQRGMGAKKLGDDLMSDNWKDSWRPEGSGGKGRKSHGDREREPVGQLLGGLLGTKY